MSVSYLNGLCSSKFLKQSIEDTKHFVLFKRIKMPSFKRMQQTLKFSLWKKNESDMVINCLLHDSVEFLLSMQIWRGKEIDKKYIDNERMNEQKETWICFYFCCYTFWACMCIQWQCDDRICKQMNEFWRKARLHFFFFFSYWISSRAFCRSLRLYSYRVVKFEGICWN